MRRTRTWTVLLVAAVAVPVAPGAGLAHHTAGHTGGPGTACERPHYPPKQCDRRSASASPDHVAPGGQFMFTAQGFRPGSTIPLRLQPTPRPLGVVQADDWGYVETLLTVPADVEVGDHEVVADGLDAEGISLTLTAPLTVVTRVRSLGGSEAAPSPTGGEEPRAVADGEETTSQDSPESARTGGTGTASGDGSQGRLLGGVALPRTGLAIGGLTLGGVALLVVGGAALTAGRRRRDDIT